MKKLHTNLKIVHFGVLMAWIERVAAVADDPTHRKHFWRTLTRIDLTVCKRYDIEIW